MQLAGSTEWLLRKLLGNPSQGCLGRGSLSMQGVRWEWEAVSGVPQERAWITGIYFPQVSFPDDK